MKKITKEELASRLNGRSYRNEITPEEERLAKDNHLVVVFGASDDLVELRGAIHDELGMGSFYLTRNGVFESDCNEGDACPYYRRRLTAALQVGEVLAITPRWGGEEMDKHTYAAMGKPTWCFESEQLEDNFAAFDVFDEYDGDREYFCRGIVIDLNEVFQYRAFEPYII